MNFDELYKHATVNETSVLMMPDMPPKRKYNPKTKEFEEIPEPPPEDGQEREGWKSPFAQAMGGDHREKYYEDPSNNKEPGEWVDSDEYYKRHRDYKIKELANRRFRTKEEFEDHIAPYSAFSRYPGYDEESKLDGIANYLRSAPGIDPETGKFPKIKEIPDIVRGYRWDAEDVAEFNRRRQAISDYLQYSRGDEKRRDRHRVSDFNHKSGKQLGLGSEDIKAIARGDIPVTDIPKLSRQRMIDRWTRNSVGGGRDGITWDDVKDENARRMRADADDENNPNFYNIDDELAPAPGLPAMPDQYETGMGSTISQQNQLANAREFERLNNSGDINVGLVPRGALRNTPDSMYKDGSGFQKDPSREEFVKKIDDLLQMDFEPQAEPPTEEQPEESNEEEELTPREIEKRKRESFRDYANKSWIDHRYPTRELAKQNKSIFGTPLPDTEKGDTKPSAREDQQNLSTAYQNDVNKTPVKTSAADIFGPILHQQDNEEKRKRNSSEEIDHSKEGD